jgi:hypothetical protein
MYVAMPVISVMLRPTSLRTNFLADAARNVVEWVMIENEALFTHEDLPDPETLSVC